MRSRFVKFRFLFLSVVLFIQLSGLGRAEELTGIYQRYLPVKYIDNTELREQLESLLQAKSRIHPDLIYYYIAYYNMLSLSTDERQKAESNSFKSHINVIERKFLDERNHWAERQIKDLNNMNISHEVKARIEGKFRKLIVPLFTDPGPGNMDSGENRNLLDFYTCLFLNPQYSADYSPEINYGSHREKEESRIREKIYSYCKRESRESESSEEENLTYVLDRWYILNDVRQGAGDGAWSPLPSEIIAALDKREYSAKRQASFMIGTGYSPFNTACSIKPVLAIQGFNGSFDFEMIRTMQQAAVSVGYKFYTREVVGFLSYVNAQMQYFYSFSSAAENESPGFEKQYQQDGKNYKESLGFSRSLLTPLSGHSLFLNVSTPVYVLLNAINVEAGVLAGINSVRYRFDYSYKYSKTVSYTAGSMWDPKTVNYTLASGKGSSSSEETEQHFIFSPMIGININTSAHTNAAVTLSTQYIGVFMMYGF